MKHEKISKFFNNPKEYGFEDDYADQGDGYQETASGGDSKTPNVFKRKPMSTDGATLKSGNREVQ